MAHETESAQKTALPLTIITVVDLGRLGRELANIEEFSLQSSVRDAGKQPQLPRISRALEDLAKLHKLNLLVDEDRQKLKKTIEDLRQSAPVMHFSFASDPSPNFMVKLITWLRSEVHPETLISVGLQPGIAAGCVLRTPNKYFDFSLRKYLNQNIKILTDALMEAGQ